MSQVLNPSKKEGTFLSNLMTLAFSDRCKSRFGWETSSGKTGFTIKRPKLVLTFYFLFFRYNRCMLVAHCNMQ